MGVPAAPIVEAAPAAINWGFEVFRLFVTAGLAVLGTGIFVNLWQHRERFIDERISELIKEVDSTADSAVEYWKASKPVRARKFREVLVHDNTGDRALEAELVAKTFRIGRMRSTVADFLDKKK